MRKLFAAALATLACACASADDTKGAVMSVAPPPPAAAEAVVSPSVIAELDAANRAFSAAWLRGDIDGLLDAYTQDAVVHPPAGGVLTSRDSIRPVWAPIANWRRVGLGAHVAPPAARRAGA